MNICGSSNTCNTWFLTAYRTYFCRYCQIRMFAWPKILRIGACPYSFLKKDSESWLGKLFFFTRIRRRAAHHCIKKKNLEF